MKSEWIAKYWAEILLLGIIVLAGFLNLWNLWNQSFSIPYYAAAVRSMLANPSIAFFNSFDAVGFVTVDKPPVGLWVQAASAAVFGFSNWAVTLPQALAGIGSVVLIYFIVQRPFGKPAGLISAFVLATTPVFVSTSRMGTMDAQMIFVILLAVWVALKAVRDQSLWLLLLSVILVGIGFNIKMIQAFVVVPAIIAIYLFGAAIPVRKKVVHLAVALLVLGAVSLSWAVAVDAVPAGQRPYIGSSGDNSVIGLMLGHNGEEAFVGEEGALAPEYIGNPGPLRLFNYNIYIQFGWLLSFALIGLLAWWQQLSSISLAGFRESVLFSEEGLTLLALCLWLLPALLYFSVTMGYWATYYLATIAPPLAGLVGIGAVAMYREYRGDHTTGWLLVMAVLATGLVQGWTIYRIFVYDPVQYGSLIAIGMGGSIVCAGILAWLRTKKGPCTNRWGGSVACIAVAVLFVAPGVWSCTPLMTGSTQGSADTQLADFLLSHASDKTYIAAVPYGWDLGATLIIKTGKPVMALGGYFGADQILAASDLPGLIRGGVVRYFLIPAYNSSLVSTSIGFEDIGENAAIYSWVAGHCTVVPSSEWSEGVDSILLRQRYALYDCAGAV